MAGTPAGSLVFTLPQNQLRHFLPFTITGITFPNPKAGFTKYVAHSQST